MQRRGTSGAHELALLLYGFEVALTTLVCIHDVAYWDPAVYSSEMKTSQIVKYYLPWFIVRRFPTFSCLCNNGY